MKFLKLALLTLFLLNSSYLFSAAMAKKNNEPNKNLVKKHSSSKASIDREEVEYPTPVFDLRVHDAGLLWLATTNAGFFGNPGKDLDPCTGKQAASGELPGGSGNKSIFVASLMFGGYLDSATVDGAEYFQGPLVTTGYEGWSGWNGSSNGPDYVNRELWPTGFSDGDMAKGKLKESSNIKGHEDCFYNDIYDPKATAEQQFTTYYTDKLTQTNNDDNQIVYGDGTFEQWHIPLGIEVKQKSYSWSYEYAQKFVIIDYTLYNPIENKSIYNFFMGVYFDCDIGNGSANDLTDKISKDDVGGFVQKTTLINEDTGLPEEVSLNMAWAADNDGREYTGQDASSNPIEPGPMSPLNGATSVATVRVLRNPNPKIRYSFNMYIAWGEGKPSPDDELKDWGPHWKDQYHADWKYDLTYNQKGYGDDSHVNNWVGGIAQGYGGIVEGRPLGDPGRYMVMSNEEFDYDMWKLDPAVNASGAYFPDPPGTSPEYKQDYKWQAWDFEHDGDDAKRLNIANGKDVKYILSFGPLGTVTTKNLATNNGIISNKKVWEFANGDSVKLTLAFIVNTDFHTRLEADVSKPKELYDGYNWTDAFRNVVWAERVYDIPLHDTPKIALGDTLGDGWYGEDIGKDGLFAGKPGNICWWANNAIYPGIDEGEGDFKITPFDTPINGATNEDMFAKKGNESYTNKEEGIGTTDKYGLLIKRKYAEDANGDPLYEDVRYGWSDTLLTAGDGVPDFTGPPPPPSPMIKLSTNNQDIIITWTSDNFGDKASSSEWSPDPFTRVIDFEGYQVQVSPNKISSNYVEFFSVDKDNMIYEDIRNPGAYLDKPIDMDAYLKNPEFYPVQLAPEDSTIMVKNNTNKTFQLVPFGNNNSMYKNHSKANLYDYTANRTTMNVDTTTMDTTWNWAYKLVLKNKVFANQGYVAVTASDYGDPKSKTPPLQSSPSQNGSMFNPSTVNGTEEVYVVPNPYRVDRDYESEGWETIDTGKWSELDRKIVFYNIPEKAIIRIYTLSGDLVKTLTHNGNANNNYGLNAEKWNLINDNAQSVTSGLYLFSVKDVKNDSYNQIGKFVIIK